MRHFGARGVLSLVFGGKMGNDRLMAPSIALESTVRTNLGRMS